MPSRLNTEILTVAGREVAISNPRKVLFPQAGYTKLDLARYYLAGRKARCAAPAAGRTCSCATRTASAASSSIRSARRASRPPWIEVVALRFPSGRTAEEVVPRDAAALAWMANLACLELHPHPVRADDLDHPDELRVDLDPGAGRRVAADPRRRAVVRATLDDLGLVGWPKTSGSRGIHVYVRIERRWTFDEVRRAALALAREVERRAPGLATSKWWKEERHGVFLDYNQNAKDRTVASAYSVRPDARRARVGAADLGRDRRLRSGRLHAGDDAGALRGDRRSPRRHRRASLLARALLELSARQEREGQGDAPWPPHYRKQAGEPPRVQPSKRRRRKAGAPSKSADRSARAEEGGRARRARALEGASPRGGRAPRAGRRARRRDARPLSHLDAHPRQPAARARRANARRRKRSIPTRRRPTNGAAAAEARARRRPSPSS